MSPETKFRNELIDELETLFDGSLVLKNDPEDIQGIPDLTILLPNGKWAMLECKRERSAKHRPNQDFYVDKANQMSFASFIFPENKDEVLHELQQFVRRPSGA